MYIVCAIMSTAPTVSPDDIPRPPKPWPRPEPHPIPGEPPTIPLPNPKPVPPIPPTPTAAHYNSVRTV